MVFENVGSPREFLEKDSEKAKFLYLEIVLKSSILDVV